MNRLADALARVPDSLARYDLALRYEFKLLSSQIVEYAREAADGIPMEGWAKRILAFKPNRTRRQLADVLRAVLAAAAVRDRDRLSELQDGWSSARSTFDLVVSGNGLGESVVGLLLPSLVFSFDRAERHARERTLHRVAVALRRYEVAQGRLPEVLAVLAPEYLPIDALLFPDGQSIEYDLAARWIGAGPVPEQLEPPTSQRILIGDSE
ncbi:MAG: hypothetical protein AB7O52_11290 [Planctomycetota bacterium]